MLNRFPCVPCVVSSFLCVRLLLFLRNRNNTICKTTKTDQGIQGLVHYRKHLGTPVLEQIRFPLRNIPLKSIKLERFVFLAQMFTKKKGSDTHAFMHLWEANFKSVRVSWIAVTNFSACTPRHVLYSIGEDWTFMSSDYCAFSPGQNGAAYCWKPGQLVLVSSSGVCACFSIDCCRWLEWG